MRKRHTPLSRLLAVTGAGLIILGIWLEGIQPALASSFLGSVYFFVPMGIIFASLKAMKPVGPDAPPETKNQVVLRYAAAYARLVAGLMIVGALYRQPVRVSGGEGDDRGGARRCRYAAVHFCHGTFLLP